MRQPALYPGENVRVRSPDVYVKSFRLTAYLTTQRIILTDPYNPAVPDKDLALDSVVGMEPGETRTGEPVLCVLSRITPGDIRRLFITFAGLAGSVRTGERDRWVQEITRACRQGSAPAPVPPEPEVLPLRPVSPVAPAREPGILAARMPSAGNTVVGVIVQTVQAGGVAPAAPVFPQETMPPAPRTVPGTPPSGPAPFFCMACGNRVPPGAKYCNRCGATVIPPNNEVVHSPWDPVQPREDPAALAARWGVPVAPAAGAALPGTYSGNGPAAYGPPGADPVRPALYGGVPQPGVNLFHAGVPVRRVALIAMIIVFAGILIAVGGMFAGGFAGKLIAAGNGSGAGALASGTTTDTSGSGGLSDTDAGSAGLQDTASSAVSGSADTSSGTDSGSASTAIPSTGTYVRVSSFGGWEGSYGAVPAIWAVKGSGDMIYKVDDTSDSAAPVNAVFTEDNTTGGDLTVELYRNGQLIKSGNTDTPSGSVTLATAS